MKKAIIFGIIITIILLPNVCYAEENNIDAGQIIESQSESLDIPMFLEEAEKYKTDILEDVEISDILSDAIKGDIDESTIGKKIINIFFEEILKAITTISSIILIIIIHSFLKSISDGLENKSISQIVFYVTYILIITIIMKNFSEILVMVKGTIEDLVGFINSLLPILMALMVSTRQHSFCIYVTAINTVYYNIYRKYDN